MDVRSKILASEEEFKKMEKEEGRLRDIRRLLLQQNMIKYPARADNESDCIQEVLKDIFLCRKAKLGQQVLKPYVAIFKGGRYQGFYSLKGNRLVWSTEQ